MNHIGRRSKQPDHMSEFDDLGTCAKDDRDGSRRQVEGGITHAGRSSLGATCYGS